MADGFGFSRMAKNNNNLFVTRDLGEEIQRKQLNYVILHFKLAWLWVFDEMIIFDAIFFFF